MYINYTSIKIHFKIWSKINRICSQNQVNNKHPSMSISVPSFPSDSDGKESSYKAGDLGLIKPRFDPQV